MLGSDPIRAFPCPQCGEILMTGVRSCEYCSTPVDAAAAEASADQQEQLQKAYGEANSLVLAARMFLLFFGLRFVPILGMVGTLGVLALLVWCPSPPCAGIGATASSPTPIPSTGRPAVGSWRRF
jgi:hypothetical protein